MTNQRPRKRNGPEKVSASLLAVFTLLIRFVWNLVTTAIPFLSNLDLLANISFPFYSQGYGPTTRFSPRKRKAADLKENDKSNRDENVWIIQVMKWVKMMNWKELNSGAVNNHVTAFFQDRPIFCFSDNLSYSLFKIAQYPNLWLP